MDNAKAQAQVKAIVAVLDAIAETVDEAGKAGAPTGVMYAAMMDRLSLDTFLRMLGLLEQAGRIKVRHNVAYSTRTAKEKAQ